MSDTPRLRAHLAGLALALMWLSCAGPALAAVCPSESGSYRVDVLIEMPPVTIHHNHSRAQLGLLAFHGPTNRILGITASKLRAGTSTRYGNRPLEGEGVCFWVDHIEVMLRYEALDIYIASDYTRASCQYQAILTHEKRHTGVARSYLDDYVQTIRSALASLAIPKPRDPRLVESVTSAQEKTQATIGKLLKPVIAKLRKTMEKAQNRIDSVAEYRRVETQCPKW